MNTLATRAESAINEMAELLSKFPAPDKWSPEQRAQAVSFASLLDTAQQLIIKKRIGGINYESEKKTFLENAGRTQSRHTQTAYGYALGRLDEWAGRQKINVLELTPAQADDFVYSLKGERSASSVRLDVSAASSFYTWLERRHEGVKNPFRGTRARPAKKIDVDIVIPSPGEIEIIINELPPDLAAAVAIMGYRGLRVGILPGLSISGSKFSGFSKGKDVSGALPSAALEAVKKANLPLRGPFAGQLANTLAKKIARAIEKLYKDGKVQGRYSVHDFRHAYSINEYRKDRDLYRVSKLLGHASIQVTESYLRGLGEVD